MRSSAIGICLAATALLLASLFALSLLAASQGYRDLLLVSPLNPGAPGLSPDQLEEFSKEEFLLTYEIRRPATARAANQSHPVTIVGTNAQYANLLGYPLLDGGFFTGTAMDAKSRHTALNETAAFQIFGSVRVAGQSLKLDGENWIVTGVIRDGDDETANLYVPAGVVGGQAESILVLMDESVTEAYAKNALKAIGIHENGYGFINLSRSAAAFGESFSVAWKAALFALILVLAVHAGVELMIGLQVFRAKLNDFYLRELLDRQRAELLRMIAACILLAAGVAAMLALSLQILEACLGWQDIAPITGALTAGDFGRKLLWLYDYQSLCLILFASCMLGILVCLALAFARRRNRRGRQPAQNRLQ